MKKVILVSVSILVIIIGVFAFIPKDNFVMPNHESTKDNILSIMDIDNYIIQTDEEEILYSRNWQANNEILGDIVSSYMNENNITEIGIRTNMTKNSVEFVSFDNKVNNQKFYYNENGKLVAYISTTKDNTNKATHYFSEDKQISTNIEYDNIDEYINEDGEVILQRANNIYNQYIVKKECKISMQNLSETIVNENGTLIGNINSEYPILSRSEESNAINKINKRIKQDADKRYNENVRILQNIGKNIANQNLVTEEMQEEMKPVTEYNYYIRETYEQKYLDYKTLSYIIQVQKYIGEQVETYRICKNYDLLTGKELELSDIHNKTQNEINTKLINKFQVEYDRYLLNDNIISKNISKVKFYLTNDYVVFYFDKGVITNNIPEIQLTYKELK